MFETEAHTFSSVRQYKPRLILKVHILILILIVLALTISSGFAITQASSELLSNGGFEDGNLTGWTVIGNARAIRYSHSGVFSVQLGSRSGTGQISQQFKIPSAQTGKLSFWYLGVPGHYGTTTLSISLIAENGEIIAQWNGKIDYRWHQVTYEISSNYSGQTLSLRFFGRPDLIHENPDRICLGHAFCFRPHKVIIYPVFAYVDNVSATSG